MRRSEANSSHHPNKVAVNSLPTESNKHSSGSGSSSLNNNKLSFNQQQQASQSQQIKQQNQEQNQLQKTSSSSESSSSSSTTSSSSSSGASTSSESKDTNFEYDDNEWDVGGIGDLIIDLDADIEKSSSTAAAAAAASVSVNSQTQQASNQQISANLPSVSSNNNSGGGGSNSTSNQVLNAHEKSPSSASSSRSSSSPSSPTTVSSKSSSLSSLFAPIPLRASGGQQQSNQQHSNLQKQRTSNTSPASFQSSATKLNSKVSSTKASSNLKLQQPALLAQLNSKSAASDHSRFPSSSSASAQLSNSTSVSRNYQSSSAGNHPLQVDRHGKLLTGIVPTMSSQQSGGQGAGKTATKMSIDHQATLDKGLKMKIKRTKPGTKTSEAKHEIVKAEQNGTTTNVEDNNISSSNSSSSSSSSSGKKHSQMNSAAVQPIQQTQQPTKRGSSGHRRDKTRDKTPHSRDKSDHGSGGGSSNNSNSSGSNSSSSSNANNASQSDRSSTSCNCSHDIQVNGVQAPCTNVSCVRSRTPTTTVDSANSNSLSQRISAPSAGSQQSGNTTGNSLSGNSSSNSSSSNHSTGGANSSNLFSNNNSSTNVQSSSSGTPNAPGPPKDKLSSSNTSNLHHQQQQSSPAAVSNSTSSSMSNIQQSSQTHNSSSVIHNSSNQNSSSGNSSQQQSISATVHHTISVAANCDDRSCSPPAKKPKCDPKDMIDICVGTSVGTITEPDCLGPCEPGTSVTLEGIVWHETEGGVLVVNVTWRGKTYVGTLLDCTRHDWAPPRFCDSPTEELDSRTPKGRGKRGRGAALTPDLSNFTETRSSVHSKLRNGAKGRGGRAVTTTGAATTTTTTSSTTAASSTTLSSSNSSSTTSSNTPSTSPTAFLPPRPEKRKSKDESPSPVNGESSTQQSSGQTQSFVNPVTGLNVQINPKKCKTASPCAISPVLLECPEQDCSKKYKHANGLRYHQSHAHGSGSMDEDSLQLPESPRIAPPTTPSPAPATTPQPQIPTSNATVAQVASPTAASPNLMSATVPSTPSQPTVQSATNPAAASTGGLLTTIPQSVAPSIPQSNAGPAVSLSSQMPQHPVPGGSITSGISGQALSHQQQHTMLVGAVPGAGLMGSNNQTIPEAGQPLLSQQQAQQQQQQQQQVLVANSNMANAPSRVDSQIKPSVLRFGSPSDNLSGPQNMLPGQGPIRPTPTAASMAASSGPPSAPEGVGHQPSYNQSPASVQQGLSNSKPQGYGKQKKNRSKSPVLGEYDNSTSRDNVQSPAYSDISDDSTPVVDSEISDKSQPPKHPDAKKVPEGAPPQIASLGGYSMYPFYPQQQYMVPPEHQGPKPPVSQSSLQPSSPAEYNKSKDPPLDLMTKPVQPNEPPSKESNVPPQSPAGPGPQNPNKPIPHFYPYNNYMPPGYPYNMEPNYGPISMVSDDNKLSAISTASHSMKEERSKENPSPSEHGKIPGQILPSKLMKTEPSVKEIKTEPSSHPMHPKEPPVQSMGSYPSMYQRHPVGVPPQPSQHMSREEDVRRFYMYSDQRRPNLSNNPPSNVPPVSIKEESPSPSQPPMQHSSAGISQGQQMSQISQSPQNQSSQSQNTSQQQKSVKSSLSSSQTSSSQKATNLVKDTKEDKDVKIKQEGQKPTMETQGPPPPPTSQYFLHPQYLTPNFSFDPGHPMYRNVLMSTSPYNTPPYHLPMPRFHAPEDLSRNPGPKALDVLQQAANMQYYGSHKIHELSERALKSPNSSSKASVSSPNVSQQSVSNTVSGSNIGGGPGMLQPSAGPGGPLNLQPPTGAMPPGIGPGGGVGIGGQKGDGKPGTDPSGKSAIGGGANDSRSPPPQRHVHTHHHTHVGLGYPMYTAPYGAAVLASQQAAAVAVINPFPPGPNK